MTLLMAVLVAITATLACCFTAFRLFILSNQVVNLHERTEVLEDIIQQMIMEDVEDDPYIH